MMKLETKHILPALVIFFLLTVTAKADIYEWPNENTHIGFYEELMASSKIPVDADIYLDLNNKRGDCDGVDTLGATTNVFYYANPNDENSLTAYPDKFFVCLANSNWNKYVSKRLVFMHEIGHIHAALTDYGKSYEKFYKIMQKSKGWEPLNVINLVEYYADAFAWCSTSAPFAWKRGKKYDEKYSFVYWPTKKEHKLICKKVFAA